MKTASSLWRNIVKDLLIQRQKDDFPDVSSCTDVESRFHGSPHIVKITEDWQSWLVKHGEAEQWLDDHCEGNYISHWIEGRIEQDGKFVVTRNYEKGITNIEQYFFYGFERESDMTMFILTWVK